MAANQNCWPSRDGLRIGHLNINHVYSKITDVITTLSNSGRPFHIFGFSESRLTTNMPSCDLSIPGYTILRRDAKAANETGLIIYISNVLSYKHMSHLDQPGTEATWLEISTSKSTPTLVGYCYRNPASRVDWIHDFKAMMDNVAFESKEIILLGDFNIDLQKSNPQWTNNLDTYNLHQLIKSPTRVTHNSSTLIDHIYVSETKNAVETCVPISNVSDH